jgi:hypothetical protein
MVWGRADDRFPLEVTVSGGKDHIDVSIHVAFFSATDAGHLFRLMAIIQTPTALRTFDPSMIYLAACITERLSYDHEEVEEIALHNWSFNEVVVSWND